MTRASRELAMTATTSGRSDTAGCAAETSMTSKPAARTGARARSLPAAVTKVTRPECDFVHPSAIARQRMTCPVPIWVDASARMMRSCIATSISAEREHDVIRGPSPGRARLEPRLPKRLDAPDVVAAHEREDSSHVQLSKCPRAGVAKDE